MLNFQNQKNNHTKRQFDINECMANNANQSIIDISNIFKLSQNPDMWIK